VRFEERALDWGVRLSLLVVWLWWVSRGGFGCVAGGVLWAGFNGRLCGLGGVVFWVGGMIAL